MGSPIWNIVDFFHLKYKEKQIPIEEVFLPKASLEGIELKIKRLDRVHSFISGNKYFKLKYNLLEAKKLDKKGLLSFGGAYSNHILSISQIAFLMNMDSIGFIRGEELGVNFPEILKKNEVLREAHFWKMKFEFVSRNQYRDRYKKQFLEQLQEKYSNFYILPEGGTNELALRGVGEILDEKTSQYDYICTPIGSGGTFLGLLKNASPHQKVVGFSALKKIDFIYSLIEKYQLKSKNYYIIKDYHFGGFAKSSLKLLAFIKEFKKKNGLELDFTYNAKMIYGIRDLINKNFFEKKSRILIIYTSSKKISLKDRLRFLKKINS